MTTPDEVYWKELALSASVARDEARAMLAALYIAVYIREGWEDGENENEAQQRAHDFLANCDLDPHLGENLPSVRAYIEQHTRKSRRRKTGGAT